MRQVSAAALTEISKTHGGEPINVVGIEWSEGTYTYYADKRIADHIEGKILNLGNLDEVLKVGSGSTSATITVVLDDTSGDLFGKMQKIDLHKKNCQILQTFEGMAFSDAFILFQGQAVTPIEWKEGDRQLSFTILSEVESEEVGFSPEEGQFEFVSDNLIGNVWPLCFGDVVHVPAAQSSEITTGTTTTAVGIPDASLIHKAVSLLDQMQRYQRTYNYLSNKISKATEIAREPFAIHQDYINMILEEDPLKQDEADLNEELDELNEEVEKLKSALDNLEDAGEKAIVQAQLDAKVDERKEKEDEFIEKRDKLRLQATKRKIYEIEMDNAEYEYQIIGEMRDKIRETNKAYNATLRSYEKVLSAIEEQSTIVSDSVVILNGEKFPQNQQVQIEINNVVLTGSFSGTLFTISSFDPKYTNIQIAPRQKESEDSFWITNPNINLSGLYIQLTAGYVVKVDQQIGTRCYINVEEPTDTDRGAESDDEEKPAQDELLTETWTKLDDATEFTTQEKERIEEDAIDDEVGADEIQAIREKIQELNKLLDDDVAAKTDKDDVKAFKAALNKNMTKYNKLIGQLKLPLSAQLKKQQKISAEEESFLLRAENLARLEYLRQGESLADDYYKDSRAITGYTCEKGIGAASAIMLPNWLSADNVRDAPPSTLWVAQPGSTAILHNDSSETYIANIIPSTVKSVYAYRGVNGVRRLVPVPSDYYTLYENYSLGTMNITGIKLKAPLSHYVNEDWVDGLYVTLTSSEGPNTTDVIKWIVENYTNLTVDTTTYNDVKTKLAKYPMNFALLQKRDALALVEDLAWQARCVVYVKFGVLYFKYLSETPTAVGKITEADIEEGTLSVSYSSTEDLYTKLTANWFANYSTDEPNKTIVRHNITKYGSIEEERNFSGYNIQSLVEKSATFWSIRQSNTWYIVKFKTFLTKLQLETWDSITLHLTDVFGGEAVVVNILKADYDSADGSVTLTCWAPVRAGETKPYDFAFPSDIDVSTEYPTPEDVAGGNAGNPRGWGGGNSGDFGGQGSPQSSDDFEFRPKDFGSAFLSDDADNIPVSPVAGFKQVNYKKFRVKDHEVKKEENLSDKNDQQMQGVPGKVTDNKAINKEPFHGYVTATHGNGIYTVRAKDGNEKKGYYKGNQTQLHEHQIVTVIYDEQTRRRVIIPRREKFNFVNVTSVENDHLVCQTWDLEIIRVAKPRSLRRTPWDGKTINGVTYTYNSATEREATDGSITETHQITPDYVVGDVIHINEIQGGTGVYADGEALSLVDANVDSRAWAVSNA